MEIKSVEAAIIDGELVISRKINGVAIQTDQARTYWRERSLKEALEEHLGASYSFMSGGSGSDDDV